MKRLRLLDDSLLCLSFCPTRFCFYLLVRVRKRYLDHHWWQNLVFRSRNSTFFYGFLRDSALQCQSAIACSTPSFALPFLLKCPHCQTRFQTVCHLHNIGLVTLSKNPAPPCQLVTNYTTSFSWLYFVCCLFSFLLSSSNNS